MASAAENGGNDVRSLPLRVGDIWRKVRQFITVEPVVIFFLFSGLGGIATQQFFYEKACLAKFGYDQQVCGRIGQLEDDDICQEPDDSNRTLPGVANFTELRILLCAAKQQSINANVYLNKFTSIISLLPAVVLLFAGSWSDRAGLRKPCMLLPIVADILATAVQILCAIFMHEVSLEVTVIVPQLIASFGGGLPMIGMSIFSYLTVCTEPADRNFRFACTTAIYSVVPIVANFFSGHLYLYFGFIKLAVICMASETIAVLYGLFVLKEPKAPAPSDGNPQTGEAPKRSYSSVKLRDLFDITLVIDSVKVLFIKRDFNYRQILCLTVAAYFINYGALTDVEYSYQISFARFNWITNGGIWYAYELLTTLIGTVLVMGVLSKRFGVPDPLVCIFAVCFSMVGKVIMVIAVETIRPYLFYVASSIDLFEGSKQIVIRGMVSKMVAENEIGKIIGMLSIVDAVQYPVYAQLYSEFYLRTESFFIGSIYVLSGAFLVVSLVVYIILYLMMGRSNADKARALSTTKQGIDNPAVDITAL